MKLLFSCLAFSAMASMDFKKSALVRVIKWHLVRHFTVAKLRLLSNIF